VRLRGQATRINPPSPVARAGPAGTRSRYGSHARDALHVFVTERIGRPKGFRLRAARRRSRRNGSVCDQPAGRCRWRRRQRRGRHHRIRRLGRHRGRGGRQRRKQRLLRRCRHERERLLRLRDCPARGPCHQHLHLLRHRHRGRGPREPAAFRVRVPRCGPLLPERSAVRCDLPRGRRLSQDDEPDGDDRRGLGHSRRRPGARVRVQDLPPNACPAPKGLPPCLQPPDSGPCDAALTRFAFDPETLTCVPFGYGGCAGNANRFETLEACEAACVAPLAPECADARRGDGCPCTQHEQCDGACSSVPFEQGEGCAPSSVGYCADVTEGNCACRLDTGERACGV
jgi:hypothetical protein